MKFVGVDVSTKKIAVAVMDEEGHVLELFEHSASGHRSKDRFVELVTFFDKRMREVYADCQRDCCRAEVTIEDVPFVRNRAGTIDLAQIVGAAMGVCALHFLPCRLVNNLTWKKDLGLGKRKDVKANIYEHVKNTYPYVGLYSQDSADAICIAESARRKFLKEKVAA